MRLSTVAVLMVVSLPLVLALDSKVEADLRAQLAVAEKSRAALAASIAKLDRASSAASTEALRTADSNAALAKQTADAASAAALVSGSSISSQYTPLMILVVCTLMTTLITTVSGIWQKSKENAWSVAREERAEAHRVEMNAILTKTNATITVLEKNTNSIKDALVKTTGEAEHAKGVIEGKAQVEEVLAKT